MNTSEDGNIEAFGETTKAVVEGKVAEPAEGTDGVQVEDNASEAAAKGAAEPTEERAVTTNSQTVTQTPGETVTESVSQEVVDRRTDDNSNS